MRASSLIAVVLLLCVLPADAKVSEATARDVAKFETILREFDPDGALLLDLKADELIPDRVIITVGNGWHSQPYQIRLQMAQAVWQGWAKTHTPANLDKSRLKLVDRMGNEVGGSRMWGGSLIWVQEN